MISNLVWLLPEAFISFLKIVSTNVLLSHLSFIKSVTSLDEQLL